MEQERVDALFRSYADRLVALAHARLGPKMRRRLDGQDILQSVFRSFLRRLNHSNVADQDDDLWPLLSAITLNKVGEKVRFHRAAKRTVDRESGQSNYSFREHIETVQDGIETILADREPSPAEVVAAADELYWLLSQFEPSARQAIELRMQQFNLDEIAQRLGRNERTIRRWLSQAKSYLLERDAQTDQRASPIRRRLAIAIPDDVPHLNARDYLIERLIATGGMCKVYAAIDRRDGSRVCMKVLRKRHRYLEELSSRFINEAALVRRLDHPGIVSVRGMGQLPDGGPFLIMELIDGGNLAQLARGGAAPDELIDRLLRIVTPLSFAHDRGIVHCDLKPENILCAVDGRVLLTDFGFSKQFEEDRIPIHCSPTEGGSELIAGTAGYLSPEQIYPGFGPISTRSDVYAFGVLMYWCYAGVTPSGDASVESRLHSLNSEIANHDPAQQIPIVRPEGMPEKVFAVCARCLQIWPEDRYGSIAEACANLA